MLTETDYCDYDTCVALKELGFNNLVDWYFNEEKSIVSSLARYRNTYIPRIPLYEAQKWLREEKNIHIEIPIWLTNGGVWKYNFRLQTREFYDRAIGEWDTYEEALSEGIKEVVRLMLEGKLWLD